MRRQEEEKKKKKKKREERERKKEKREKAGDNGVERCERGLAADGAKRAIKQEGRRWCARLHETGEHLAKREVTRDPQKNNLKKKLKNEDSELIRSTSPTHFFI